MNKLYQLDPHDIEIEKLQPKRCEDCDDNAVTHAVTLDLRAIGLKITVGEYCEACAKETVSEMRSGMFV